MRKNYSDKFKEKRITVTLDSDFEDVLNQVVTETNCERTLLIRTMMFEYFLRHHPQLITSEI
ncbi:MAG: hypothetical protein QF470_03940 [Methylococcales bacterium]|nr:hypothetical protein [Methylococcales bacterium]